MTDVNGGSAKSIPPETTDSGGSGATAELQAYGATVESRQVVAICRFAGGPGREREAAEAWAFELTHYFMRAVGEAPQVTYADGVYTVTGLMQTTHPFDTDPTVFDADSPPWDLDFCVNPKRRAHLRSITERRRFDGR